MSVRDDFRWLEDATNPEVKAWTEAQNAYARSVLDRIPIRERIAPRVAEALRQPSRRYPALESAGARWFVLVDAPPRQQKYLVTVEAGGSPTAAKPLVDPNEIDPSGKTSIDWFHPSPDGRRVAVSLSKAGSELGDATVYDVASGKRTGDAVPRVNGGTAGGDLAWAPDGKGFYYTRYPAPGERAAEDLAFYQQVYFHEMDRPASSDRYELGKDFPRIAEIQLSVDARTARVLATVALGDGGEYAHFLRTKTGEWKKLTDFPDRIVELAFDAATDDLWAISRRGAPRGELSRVNGRTLDVASATRVVGEQPETLVSSFSREGTFVATPKAVYALYQRGGPTEIRSFSHSGTRADFRNPLDVGSYGGLARDARSVLYFAETWLRPGAWYALDEKTGQSRPTTFAGETSVDTSAFGVLRDKAHSKDGTEVPFSALLPTEFRRDGTRACVVTGYGGYGISIEPRFRVDYGLWLERGVVYVVANVRGGGEFGDEWHRAGMLEKKPNVFDDFAAVLEHLAREKYCAPDRIGITGRSNGGILMGATLVQHPELVRAVVSHVGDYDMLHVELSPNGAFNVTEFGTVKDPAQFRALYAYSPYHNVKAGVRYPATLLLTGENDPRVDPMQSRKMAAMLQANTAGSAPILLRTSTATGHGASTDLTETIAQKQDEMAFMLDALGVSVR